MTRLYPSRWLFVFSIVFGMLWSNPGWAGGFTIPTIGTRASVTGGFVARADDTSAPYHNPAGLGLLGQIKVDLSGTAILSHTRYRRCTKATFDAQGNSTGCVTKDGNIQYEPEVTTIPYGAYPPGFGILPYLGISSRLGLKRWNFGFAFYSPHNATGAFPDCERDKTGKPLNCTDAPQRFHAMLGTINTLYFSPTVSFSPIEELHIGLTVSAVRAALTSERSLWLGGPNSMAASMDSEGWGGEGILKLDASAWTATFSLGLIWNIGRTVARENRWLRGLNIGIAYSNMSWFTLKSDVVLNSPLLYNLLKPNDGCRKGNSETFEVLCANTIDFTFPLLIRGGFHWKVTDQFSFGFDIFWQNYSVYEEIRVEFDQPLDLSGIVQVDKTVEKKDSSDSFTISAGVGYDPAWAPGLSLRLGFLWDQSPYPDSTYSLLSPDADKYGITIGIGYKLPKGFEITAAYLPVFYADRIVRDSVMTPAICPKDDPAARKSCETIAPSADFSANGDVTGKRVDMFSLQVGWAYDK